MKIITNIKLSLITAAAVGAMTLQPVIAQMANNSGSNTSNNAAFDMDGRDQGRSSDGYNSRGQNSSGNSSMSESNYSRDKQSSNSNMNNTNNNTMGTSGSNRSLGSNTMGNNSGMGRDSQNMRDADNTTPGTGKGMSDSRTMRDNPPQRSGMIHNAIINQQGILTHAQHIKTIANAKPAGSSQPASSQPIVTLRGSVVTEGEKILIYSIVKRLAGNNDIRNEIEVRATDS